MNRFWLVLLSLGLVVVFTTTAMAVDVKFSGEYSVTGLYLDKTSFKKGTATDGPSTAFYFQRLRVKANINISPGLELITRADIMERAWGAARSAAGTDLARFSAGTKAENENIAFDYAYFTYTSTIGQIGVGYMSDGEWGTVFSNNANPLPKVHFATMLPLAGGQLIFGAQAAKVTENSRTANKLIADGADKDADAYYAFISHKTNSTDVGFLAKYIRNATNRNMAGGLVPGTGYKSTFTSLLPYAKVNIGPVALQTEIVYTWGDGAKWEGAPALIRQQDIKITGLSGWVDAMVNLDMFYFGGSVAYVAGDDPSTKDTIEGVNNGGADWMPCLIMFNSELNYWAGEQTGFDGSQNDYQMKNAWFFQARGGVKPIDKLNIMASVSFANADKKPTAAWVYNDYGWEVDLTATYKITNNLSYMLGAGYLFTGKYFKGTSDLNEIGNDYLVINKLTLTF